jgi:hypothetical protein
MPAQRHKPRAARCAGALFALLLSGPAAAVELHLDAAALQVARFTLPADRALTGVEQWQLAGAMHSNQAQRSRALISVNGSAPLAVQVGEVIAQGVQLQAVYADHVLLRRGDSSTRLFLQQAAGGTGRAAAIAAEPVTSPPISADCARFSEARVPQEELETLGICPPSHTNPQPMSAA